MIEPYITGNHYQLYHGKCLDVLREMPDNSVDAVVTDPPYGINFMGKKWDYRVPTVEEWKECLRVLKPGGHLLSFAGTRTQHRMAVNIEDAGFEIRDMIAWVYGCLSEDTNIFTMEGEKPYTAIKPGENVLCYDKCNKEYSYQPVEKMYEYEIKDTVYRIQSDFTDQIVSRNHRCLVERGGREVFMFAEELNSQENIPFLEDVSSLQTALSNLYKRASVTEKDLFKNLHKSSYRQEKLQQKTIGKMQRYDTSYLFSVWNYFLQKQKTFRKSENANVLPSMQWSIEGRGVEKTRIQGEKKLEAGVGDGTNNTNDWTKQSELERWHNIQETKGKLQGGKMCPLPESLQRHGEEGWLYNGASSNNGTRDWEIINPGRSSSPCKSHPFGQQNRKSDAICDKSGSQTVREWEGHRTSVATITPIQYEGKIWCVKVPTGSFVAVRNGKAFATGNSGFPKSHDISKAIDRVAGAEREVVSEIKTNSGGMAHISKTNAEHGFRPAAYNGHSLNDSAKNCIQITAPATPEAQQWAGWGTAIKPSFEPVTWATKPVDTMDYCAKILKNLKTLEVQCLQIANAAESSSRPTPAGSQEAKIVSAQEPVATLPEGDPGSGMSIGKGGATNSPADSSASTLVAASIALSIASSWRHTLEGVCAREKTSTTETESKTTTDWKTLSCYLSQITPEDIIQACSLPGGFNANACTAAQIFNASLQLLSATHTLSAIEPATWQELDSRHADAVSPNLDPCIMARKPLTGTVAANVLKYGTGGINIDGCRVEATGERLGGGGENRATFEKSEGWSRPWMSDPDHAASHAAKVSANVDRATTLGRWPANLIHDGSDEVVGLFPQTGPAKAAHRGTGKGKSNSYGVYGGESTVRGHDDNGGSAARFFYCAKASKKDKNEGLTTQVNDHPTVKPTDLMLYLCRLVTPPGGTVLDPFLGSGTTGKASLLEGFNFIGIEMEEPSLGIAHQRIQHADTGPDGKTG
jgi:DNA modification methylase